MQNTVRYMQILAYFTDIIDAGKMQEGDRCPLRMRSAPCQCKSHHGTHGSQRAVSERLYL